MCSIKHEKGKKSVCDPTVVLGIPAGETDAFIRYTYSVEFEVCIVEALALHICTRF